MKRTLPKQFKQLTLVSVCAAAMAACSSTPTTTDNNSDATRQKLAEIQQRERALEAQKNELEQRQRALSARESALSSAKVTTSGSSSNLSYGGGPLLPPNAQPGECFARVFVPPTYKTVTETLLKRAESEEIQIIPASYKTVEKSVLVSEESTRRVKIPAKYKTESKTIEVSPRELTWRKSLKRNSGEASKALLQAAQDYGIKLDDATPGSCYTEHYFKPVYETVSSQELVAEESATLSVVPAKYKTVTERVLVSEATTKLVKVPTTYRWTEEKVLVRAAYTDWKKGRGLIEKVDNNTGEIMCLVEIPAQYKTVRKKVVDKPAHTITKEIPAVYKTIKVRKMVQAATERSTVIPAKYKTVKNRKMVSAGYYEWHKKGVKNSSRTGQQICLVETPAKYRTVKTRVVVSPAKTEEQTIPAVYKTVKVRVVDQEASQKRIKIPAEYQQVTKQTKVTDSHMEWRNVLCETNTTPGIIKRLQAALNKAGYDAGPADGIWGRKTTNALKSYQRSQGLATGGLTLEAMKKLGVR